MSQRSDFEHVSDLVHLCAETMRLISKGKLGDTRDCPFRHIVLELENLSDEIKDIADDLPPDWNEDPV